MIYNIGATYQSVGIGSLSDRAKSLSNFARHSSLRDYVLLNTCNRAELYSTDNLELNGFDKCLGDDAIRHLFKVACGLDSMIVGENEILGQIKVAMADAEAEGHIDDVLSDVFNRAVRLGSRVRAKTKIAYGKTSVASIAVDYALNQSEYPVDEVLVIGSGELGSKIACALKNKGVNQIFLANRCSSRAKRLAEKVSGSVADYKRLPKYLKSASVVFTATGAPHSIIRPEMIADNRILFVDLGIPYDVSEDARALKNVDVVRLEHFEKISAENRLAKSEQIKKVKNMIEDGIKSIKV